MTSDRNIKTHCIYALAAGVLTLISGIAVEDFAVHHQRNAPMFQFGFEENLKKPVIQFPVPNEVADFVTEPGQWRGIRAKAGGYTPIVRWARHYPVEVASDRKVWIAPDLYYSGTGSSFDSRRLMKYVLLGIAALAVAAATFVLTTCFPKTRYIVVGLCLLRTASLFWTFGTFGYYSLHSFDESIYLAAAKKILALPSSRDDYIFTIGLSLLYIPILSIFPDISDFGFAAIFSALSYLIFGLGVIILVTFLMRRLRCSPWTILGIGLILALYPWFVEFRHREPIACTTIRYPFQFPVDAYRVSTYYFSQLTGYTARSDTAAMCLSILSFLLAMRSRCTGWQNTLAGGILGFSCIIRMSNVYLILPAMYLFVLHRGHWRYADLARFWVTFGLGLGPLAIWNWVVFGNPWTLGYEVYNPDAAKGFELSHLASGIHIYSLFHLQLMALAGLALLTAPRSQRDLMCFLALQVLPLLAFYSGYYGASQDPVRLLIHPLTFMLCCVGVLFTRSMPTTARAWLQLIAAIPFVIHPIHSFVLPSVPIPTIAARGLWLFGALLSWWFVRDWRYVLYCLIYVTGLAWAPYLFLCCACFYAIVIALKDKFRTCGSST